MAHFETTVINGSPMTRWSESEVLLVRNCGRFFVSPPHLMNDLEWALGLEPSDSLTVYHTSPNGDFIRSEVCPTTMSIHDILILEDKRLDTIYFFNERLIDPIMELVRDGRPLTELSPPL